MPDNNFVSILPTFSMLLVAVGLLVGAWQYSDANAQRYKQEIWSAQKILYELAVESAAEIANGTSIESVSESRKRFWKLYWGKLAMLESRAVETAMAKFGVILGDCESNPNTGCFHSVPGNSNTNLQIAALNLAHCTRLSLQETWEPVKLESLVQKCPY